jgi:DNA-3-methyladenine glycosylase
VARRLKGRLKGRTLSRGFYARDSRVVAPELLGKVVVHDDPQSGLVAARIVEVEAYAGAEDPGSHGHRGMTPRTTTMFGPGGRLYVYFTYGMHWCANVVTGREGESNAVLLRAAAPLEGIDVMRARRTKARRDRDLCSGPAKLAQALAIGPSHDGADLVRGVLRIVDDGTPPPASPGVSMRIGLAAGKGDEHPWRWFVPGDVNVSTTRPGARAGGSNVGRAARSNGRAARSNGRAARSNG